MTAPRVSNADGGAACVAPKKQAQHRPNKGSFRKGDARICRDGAAKSKGHDVSNYFRKWLEETPDGLDCSRLDTLLTYLWDIASAANKQSVDAIKLLLERGYGKPVQAISGPDGGAIQVSFAALVADKAGE
jgi:hypothetical protein